jgi:hypothetical protein
MVRFEGVQERLHRLSAHYFLGFDMDSKLLVLHRCNSKRCWNPEHLHIGDTSDNYWDEVDKSEVYS